MITLREIADNKTNISSTRWAFGLVILFDIIIIAAVILTAIVGHFVGKPIDSSLFGSVALLLGIPTSLITGAKITQGFESNKGDCDNGKHSS